MLAFWATFAALSIIVIICDRKYSMLRDQSVATPQPYSWSRVQLAWWSVIILSSFISIFLTSQGYQVPSLSTSTLILLGISGATTVTARTIDVSDASNNAVRHQDSPSQNFLLDILSDSNGASVHRFQAIVFNFVFGCWFIVQTIRNINGDVSPDLIMPVISDQNLVLLGLSSATYAAMKTTENKSNSVNPNPSSTPTAVTSTTTTNTTTV